LSFDHLIISDVDGERRIDAGDLPLRVGTGSDCGLRLPGPGGGPVMLLDLLDGAPFVQPFGRDDSVQINGVPLTASTRLNDQDELQFFGSKIRVVATEDRLNLQVHLEDSAYVTQAPESPETAAVAEDEAIAPTAFRRATATSAKTAETHRSPLKGIVGVSLAVLLVSSYLLFSSASIQFDVKPAEPDDISISGGWFRFPIGDRILLRQGEYTVNVKKEGYYDISQNFSVDEEPSKTVEVSMRRLPGQLSVITEPAVDAVVSIDSSTVGTAPFGPAELQPGEHSVSVRADRFLPFGDVISVPGLGKHEELFVQLVPRWSNVDVVSEPAVQQSSRARKRLVRRQRRSSSSKGHTRSVSYKRALKPGMELLSRNPMWINRYR
jgi:hypothetical protein